MITRRKFIYIASIASAGCVGLNPGPSTSPLTTGSVLDQIRVLVDTIIPRDQSPGALDLGVAELVSSQHLEAVCIHLQRTTSMFNGADVDLREQILMQAASPGAPHATAIRSLVMETMKLYYSRVEGQRSVGYRAPVPID